MVLLLAFFSTLGCGTTAQRGAMEQLLVSDAVDQAVAKIDFAPLSGRKVFLNAEYLKTVKTHGYVNADYVISTLRNQILAAGCYLQDKIEDAEIVIEPRVGSLGTDEYNITYGLPRSETAASVASLASNSPVGLPALPELALSKSEYRQGFAKLSVFAYRREDQTAVWQSGVAKSTSTSRDTWVFGAGPIQRGTVYDGTRFAGARMKARLTGQPIDNGVPKDLSYRQAKIFDPNFDPSTRLATLPEELVEPGASELEAAAEPSQTPNESPETDQRPAPEVTPEPSQRLIPR